jgi:hypothetical protein
VIAWKAPKSGTVTVSGNMRRHESNDLGDGVRVRILKNSSQVWPSSGRQLIEPISQVGARHVAQVGVATNDVIYFHLDENASSSYDWTRWDPVVEYNASPRFTTDAVERVADVGSGKIWDSPISAVHQTGDNDWYRSEAWAQDQYKYNGPLDDPLETTVFHKTASQFYSDPHSLGWNWWVMNVYEIDDDEQLAFCHLESASGGPRYWRLGLAYSDDGGSTFTRLGFIVSQDVESLHDDGEGGNIQGVPWFIKDGYFYVFYADWNGYNSDTAVARAAVSDVISDARSETVGTWTKYRNGGWSEAGMGGRYSAIHPGGDFHADAAYSTTKSKYIISARTESDGLVGVYLLFSDDGVSGWEDNEDLLLEHQRGTYAGMISIVDADSTDNGQVGTSFYVYWSYGPTGWGSNRYLYRQLVTLQ